MISKNIETEHGQVSSVATIEHTDNGQTVIHVVSNLGDFKHEHRVTVGSEDGVDAVAEMSDEDLKSHLQKHLDFVRMKAATVLANRAKTKKAVAGLN